MKFLGKRKILCVFGKTGSGKSYFTKKYIAKYSRIFIVDIHGEYEGSIVNNFNELADISSPIFQDKFKISFRTDSFNDIDYAMQLVYLIGNITFVAEESAAYLETAQNADTPFNKLLFFGRHRDINIIAISQRPVMLATNVRSQTDSILFFRLADVSDLGIIEKYGLSFQTISNQSVGEFTLIGEPLE